MKKVTAKFDVIVVKSTSSDMIVLGNSERTIQHIIMQMSNDYV